MAGEYFGEHSLRALVQLIKEMANTHVSLDAIVDNLQDSSSDKVLSAKQGKVLYDLLMSFDADGDGKVDSSSSLNGFTDDDFVKKSEFRELIENLKNISGGIAGIDSTGKIPTSIIPESVGNNIIEGFLKVELGENGLESYYFYEDSDYTIPIEGSAEKIYIDISSDEGTLYRFTGSKFVPLANQLNEMSTDDVKRIWDEIEV